MFKKIVRVYKQSGLLGVFLTGTSYEFKQISKLFSNSAKWFLKKIPILPNHKDLLMKNHIFNNKHMGCRCFVIGNGSSLKKQDLSLLSNEITITVNAFYTHPIVEKWQPKYYCLTDPVLFDGSTARENFFQNLRQKIHSSKFLVPLYAKNVIESHQLLPIDKTYYVAFLSELSENVNYNIDLTKSIPGTINVVELGIMWAMFMGCSPIYLVGLDHDWLSHRSMQKHFYTENKSGDSLKTDNDLGKHYYKSILQSTLALWCGYETILKIASNKNISIINATEGGFLDVFNRGDYESIFKENHKN